MGRCLALCIDELITQRKREKEKRSYVRRFIFELKQRVSLRSLRALLLCVIGSFCVAL